MVDPVPPAERGPSDPFASVDADLELLADLEPGDQVPVFHRIHTALTGALAATAGPPAPGGPGRPPGGR